MRHICCKSFFAAPLFFLFVATNAQAAGTVFASSMHPSKAEAERVSVNILKSKYPDVTNIKTSCTPPPPGFSPWTCKTTGTSASYHPPSQLPEKTVSIHKHSGLRGLAKDFRSEGLVMFSDGFAPVPNDSISSVWLKEGYCGIFYKNAWLGGKAITLSGPGEKSVGNLNDKISSMAIYKMIGENQTQCFPEKDVPMLYENSNQGGAQFPLVKMPTNDPVLIGKDSYSKVCLDDVAGGGAQISFPGRDIHIPENGYLSNDVTGFLNTAIDILRPIVDYFGPASGPNLVQEGDSSAYCNIYKVEHEREGFAAKASSLTVPPCYGVNLYAIKDIKVNSPFALNETEKVIVGAGSYGPGIYELPVRDSNDYFLHQPYDDDRAYNDSVIAYQTSRSSSCKQPGPNPTVRPLNPTSVTGYGNTEAAAVQSARAIWFGRYGQSSTITHSSCEATAPSMLSSSSSMGGPMGPPPWICMVSGHY